MLGVTWTAGWNKLMLLFSQLIKKIINWKRVQSSPVKSSLVQSGPAKLWPWTESTSRSWGGDSTATYLIFRRRCLQTLNVLFNLQLIKTSYLLHDAAGGTLNIHDLDLDLYLDLDCARTFCSLLIAIQIASLRTEAVGAKVNRNWSFLAVLRLTTTAPLPAR